MKKDFNMAFAVLGIEKTKDENLIRSAYHMALPQNNPEDNPAGFQSLRWAYEQALEYCRTPGDDAQAAMFMADADTPIGAFLLRLDRVFKHISTRLDADAWRELLQDELFESLDGYEEAKWALFGYLVEHYRLPREIYLLLDEFFHIAEKERDFMERLPAGFVDYMTVNISNPNGGYTLEWMQKLRGAEDADYDTFLEYLNELSKTTGNDDPRRADYIRAIDALGIWHPYYALDKARHLVMAGQKEEAEEIVLELVDKEEYRDDLRVQMFGGEVLWRAGRKEKAYGHLRRSLKLSGKNYIGNKYCAFYEQEQGKLREALRHIYVIRNTMEDDEVTQAEKQLEEEFIALCEKQPADTLAPSDTRLLAYAYLYQNEPDKAKAALVANADREREIKGYHMLLATIYRQKNDYENAAREEKLRLAVVQEMLDELKAGKPPRDGEDTLESLQGSLSDARMQLGLISMTRAKEEKTPDLFYAQFEAAAQWLAAACEAVEGNYAARLNLAHCYLELHQYQKAYDLYETAIGQLGEQGSLLGLKQRACYEMGNKGQEVIDLFYRLLKRGEARAEHYAYAAREFLDYKQLDDAKIIFGRAESAGVESYGLRVLRNIYDRLCVREYDSGLELAMEALLREGEEDADNPETADYLAELYYAKAMYATQFRKNREPHLKSAIEAHDREKYRVALAQWYRENGEQEKALAQYRYIEKYFAGTPELYLKLARCYMEQEDRERMHQMLQKALSFEEKGIHVYKEAALLYDELNWDEESVKLWETYIGFSPADIGYALQRCGQSCMLVERYEDALKFLKQSLEYAGDKEKYHIYITLGGTYFQLSQPETALECVEKALSILHGKEKNQHYALQGVLLLARVYKELGRKQEMFSLIETHLEDYTADRLSAYVRGVKEIYAECGEYERAFELLERYRKAFAEPYYTYLWLDMKYCACLTKKEKKKALKDIEKAFHKYGTEELRGLYRAYSKELGLVLRAPI